MIYHIVKIEEWEQVKSNSHYTPASFEQDGFIHLCEVHQIEGVLSRYFVGQGELVALRIEPEALHAPLRYENISGGEEFFPHLYGPLNIDAVREVICIRSEQDRAGNSASVNSSLPIG